MTAFDLATTGKIELMRQVTDSVAAEIVGVKPSTLRKWRLTPGRGPKWRRLDRRAIRYDLGELQDWMTTRLGGGEGR